MKKKYVRVNSNKLLNDGDVVYFWRPGIADAVLFRCPCGQRQVYVKSPPHKIIFDNDGLLTIKNSVGYSGERDSRGRIIRKNNWCHFSVVNGTAIMYTDSECPGKEIT